MTNLPDNLDNGDADASDAEIAKKLEPYLRPEKKQQGIQVVTTLIRRIHSGPLPAPEDFEHYNNTLPGGAERIMQLTEKEQSHRHTQEGRLITGEFATRIIGQIGAILSLFALVGLVGYCATIGQPVTATIITAIGAIVIGFLKYSAQKLDEPKPPSPPSKPRKKGRR